MKNPKNYFIQPEEFLAHLKAWQARGKIFEDQDDLVKIYYRLAEETVPVFGHGHLDKDDLIQASVIACARRAKYFHEDRGSPFNFFTKIIINEISTEYSREARKFPAQLHMSIDEPSVQQAVDREYAVFQEGLYQGGSDGTDEKPRRTRVTFEELFEKRRTKC